MFLAVRFVLCLERKTETTCPKTGVDALIATDRMVQYHRDRRSEHDDRNRKDEAVQKHPSFFRLPLVAYSVNRLFRIETLYI